MTDSTQTGLGIREIIGDKRDAVLQLAAQHGAYNVRVFGSVARGEATPTSDVDLLVEWDYARLSAWGSAELFSALETLLGHSVDIVSEKGLRPTLKARVLAEAVPL